jgi:hypothetical protein
MNQLQQLIEWMEEEIKEWSNAHDEYRFGAKIALRDAIVKAKELQATEQCKWAVVDKEKIFDTEEDARECCLFFWDYTIVKIIP